MTAPTIVWLRDDLRLADNPALTAATERGAPVVLVYILDDDSPEVRPLGAASRWWLHGSLTSLAASTDGNLVLRRGAAETVIPALVAETGADAVFWNRRYGAAREIDARLKSSLRDNGLDVQSFQANLLFEPWTVTTGDGNAFRVFTPFWKAARQTAVRAPLPAPRVHWATAAGDDLESWELLPTHPDWAGGLRESWHPGEEGAHDQLESFADERLADYHRRDEPAVAATSQLSPHLSFGEISPFQIWERMHGDLTAAAKKNVAKFLSEVGWREFNANILFHFPELAGKNYRPAFDAFPWSEPVPAELEAWQQGRTGIPIVDAGMRELWHTGYMHNRVRMIVASLLVKNMLIDWRVGEQWFWDCLVDADEASNPGNWQWVAGSGADAAPYFRVFNPMLQADKFDGQQRYIRRWVPEVGTDDYPEPIVDLAASRRDALAAYEHVKAAR
ncbi:deoxyribodipyrimidine photo-lyase [Salinibacterium sp. G-O1]|uniref:cryptochrome/photolyase family protein n=1 Tax=Salinibacterium sp. G-O1 TaxID=3046208 RepID=UPI0024B912FE|nr:deoxyribodipyrimidine photo-lyase [Salinibacterium sp. G-O1]MDJ0336341.1 deoxyribodipyrimidine photo-lyase [Salinibacterium sp. G-O1]